MTRWTRDALDGRLHAVDLPPAEVRGYAEAPCGHRLPADVDPRTAHPASCDCSG
jgi:hypothetical protein